MIASVAGAAIGAMIDRLPPGAGRDDGLVAEAARRALRRTVRQACGRRPITEVHVVRLSSADVEPSARLQEPTS